MKKTIRLLALSIFAVLVSHFSVRAQNIETPVTNDSIPFSASNPITAPLAVDALADEQDGPYLLLLPLVIQGSSNTESEAKSSLLADGQFVDGPNVGNFDVENYLTQQQSPLLPFASVISDKASYYSVNPRVVLTILELLYPSTVGQSKGGQSKGGQSNDRLLAAAALPEEERFSALLENLLIQLTEHFYGQLYGRNLAVEDAKAYQLPKTITLRGGESVAFEVPQNAASDAIELALAGELASAQWKRLAFADQPDSFAVTYQRLFPDSDPLDNSNQIRPPAAPAEDLLQASATSMPLLKLPFAAGDSWRFTGGPHAYDGCSNNAFSAVDFAPIGYSGCSDPIAEDRWITAPADATISRVSCGGCNVALTIGNGWGTRFYHVANPLVSAGEKVVSDQRIGNPSCAPIGIACGACTGSNTGVHQHVDLLYNGAFVAIEGAKFEEYTVRGEACYQGYLEKDGDKYYPPARITSMPDTVAPTATVAIAGNIGQGEWYQRPLTLTLSGVDERSAIQSIAYALQSQSSLSETEPIEASGPTITLTVEEDGVYTLTAKVSDMTNNWSSSKTLSFRVDGTAPENPVIVETGCSSLNDQWQNSCNTPSFEWDEALDVASGVAGYELFWAPSGISATTAIYTTTRQFTPDPVAEGESILHLRTVDQAGNWSDWQDLFLFGFDTIAPTGSITINQDAMIARSALVSVTTVVSDSGKTGEMRLRNGEDTWNEWQASQDAITWQLHGENGEEVTVAAQFRDAAGNLSQVVSDTIRLNTRIAQATSSRYQLVRSVLGATSSQAISSRFALKSSSGQSSAIGALQSPQYHLAAGYLRLELPADLAPAPTRTPPPITIEPEQMCMFSIAYGALFTDQTLVEIQLDVTGAELMKIRPSEIMDRSAMEPYSTTTSIDLPAPVDQISTLTAYGVFGGQNGVLCRGEILSDTITYDPLPPTINLERMTVDTGNGTREGSQHMSDFVRIVASDQANGSGVSEMQLSTKADFAEAEWQPFKELIPLPVENWNSLYIRVKDNAGNVSATVTIANEVDFQVFLPLVGR